MTGTDSANSCMFPDLPCRTLQQAANSSNPTGDTIHIGPGTFAGVTTGNDIAFEGAGAGTLSDASGATVVDGSPHPAFHLTDGGSLSNLRTEGGQTSEPQAIEMDGPVTAPAATYTISGVIGFANPCTSCHPLMVSSPTHQDASLLNLAVSDSTFVSTGDSGTTAYVTEANGSFVRTSLLQQGNSAGGMLIESGTITFSDGTIGTPAFGGGVTVAVGGHATFTRTRLTGLFVSGTFAPVTAAINDSLVSSSSSALQVMAAATVTARNSTFVAEGPAATAAADLEAGTSGDAVVNSTGSIFRAHGGSGSLDVTLADGGGHDAIFTAANSSYTSVSTGGGTATPAGSGTNIAGDPGFANEAGGDFRLSAGSPLIDKGPPENVGETDLIGVTRSVDGNCDGVFVPDIGAFEFVPSCPPRTSPPTAAVLSKVHMTHRRFRVGSPGAARAPKGTRFVYTLLGNGAKVTVTIDRPAAGRKKGKRCVKPRRGLHRRCTRHIRKGSLAKVSAIGQNSLPFSGKLRGHRLAPGRYRATLVAVNSAGRSKPSHLTFTIVRR